MNTSAQAQQYSTSNFDELSSPYRFIRLSFSAKSLSIDTVKKKLNLNEYTVLADLSASAEKDQYCLLIEAEVHTLELTAFSKWFMKKIKPDSLHSKLENKAGEVIAECKLYCDGNKSF
ncbi:hypothetical protein WH96_10140 [Kiloniella spongiae]|uniref:Uncharacterized protein n=1 Tax=Kiloniella spongiae TaxID=1489064 RepID=A0A0H2ME32_9PROT|nr:hypothetical protein [Kiloniella spongiae]KLN60819.1 hypothetical protein WH96_10140 [Kiloniella spongiae]